MANNDNLVPWKSGQSGNPAGRPKDTPLVRPAIRRFLQLTAIEVQALIEDPEARSRLKLADALALAILEKALYEKAWGDVMKMFVVEQSDGKLPKEAERDEDEGPDVVWIEAPARLGFAKKKAAG